MKETYIYPCAEFLDCMEYYDLTAESLEDFAQSHCAACPERMLSKTPYDELERSKKYD